VRACTGESDRLAGLDISTAVAIAWRRLASMRKGPVGVALATGQGHQSASIRAIVRRVREPFT